MTEEPLTRIPFSPQDEATISSMSRWMSFMGIVIVVCGLCSLLAGFLMTAVSGPILSALAAELSKKSPQLAHLADQQWMLVVFGCGALVLAAAHTYAGFALFRAGDELHLVAVTDDADQVHVEHGVDRLLTYFKLQVLLAVGTVALIFLVLLMVIPMLLPHA